MQQALNSSPPLSPPPSSLGGRGGGNTKESSSATSTPQEGVRAMKASAGRISPSAAAVSGGGFAFGGRRQPSINSTPSRVASDAVVANSNTSIGHHNHHRSATANDSNLEIFVVLGSVLEAVWHRPYRPLREVVQYPQFPQRDMYQYRVFVNLLWFAKNYLVFMLAWMVLWGISFPIMLANVALFGMLRLARLHERAEEKKLNVTVVHSDEGTSENDKNTNIKNNRTRTEDSSDSDVETVTLAGENNSSALRSRRSNIPPLDLGSAAVKNTATTPSASRQQQQQQQQQEQQNQAPTSIGIKTVMLSSCVKFLQLICCMFMFYQYGACIPIVVAIIPVAIIAAHSVLSPYSDDAATYFESIVSKKGGAVEAPSTPVLSFEPTAFQASREQFEKEKGVGGAAGGDGGTPIPGAVTSSASQGIGSPRPFRLDGQITHNVGRRSPCTANGVLGAASTSPPTMQNFGAVLGGTARSVGVGYKSSLSADQTPPNLPIHLAAVSGLGSSSMTSQRGVGGGGGRQFRGGAGSSAAGGVGSFTAPTTTTSPTPTTLLSEALRKRGAAQTMEALADAITHMSSRNGGGEGGGGASPMTTGAAVQSVSVGGSL